MADLLQRIEQSIQNRKLLKRGQAILVAVSGGLDSKTLLHVIHALSARHRWKLTVAHFNHQLRGRSSNADEQLVRKTAMALKLPIVVERANVRKFAQKSGLSIEMAARKLRHEFFVRVAKERGIHVVALAHHADDQVELFFLRVLRGTGGEGMTGMKWRSPSPVNRKISLVRPLLDLTKDELHGFAQRNKIHFREDKTNTLLNAPRNRIRNELLPLLRRKYQPALAKAVLRLMEIVGVEAEAIGETAQQWLKETGRDGPPGRPADPAMRRGVPAFEKLPIAVQRRVLQLQLASLGIAPDFDLVEGLRRSADLPISVSSKFSVLRDATGRVILRSRPSAEFRSNKLAVNLAGRAGEVGFDGLRIRWHLNTGRRFSLPGGQKAREFFDADKVGNEITLRHWRAGDRFQPMGFKLAAKLQDLFTNAKIPRAQRHDLIVAETAGGEIFWVEGLRMAENFKLTPRTRRRFIWRWHRCPNEQH
ncbi:MAG: tRNA lysidine(34) synthetase TilS [Verrucomicrobiota bacterium]